MFSAQNGIFLQIQMGGFFLYFMRGFRKKDGEGNCDSRLQKKTEQIIRKPKSFDMDFGFRCFLKKLTVIGEQKKR